MADKFSKLLGSRIRYFRNLNGFTQAALAEKIGVEPETLGHIEIGKNLPSMSRLPVIAKSLGVNVWQLFIKQDVKTDEDLIKQINELLKAVDKGQLKFIYEFLGSVINLKKK